MGAIKVFEGAQGTPGHPGQSRCFLMIVHLVNFYNIPASLIVNMDQTGVILLMTNKQTYETKGSRDVAIAHTDEK